MLYTLYKKLSDYSNLVFSGCRTKYGVKRTSIVAGEGGEKKGQNQRPPSFCYYSQIDFFGPGAALQFVCALCVFSAAFSLSVNPSALALGRGKSLHIRSQEAPPGSSVPFNPENSHAGEIAGPSVSLLLETSKSGIGDLEDREAKSAGSLHAGQPKSLAESPWFSAGGSKACAQRGRGVVRQMDRD